MPEENQNDALAEAVKRGLELALQGGAVQRMIASIMEQNERNQGQSGNDGGVGGFGKMARQATEIYRQRQEEKATQEALHNAGDGISPTGSSASANLADAEEKARRSLGSDPRQSVFEDRPYQIIPPSFGDFVGKPSPQSFFSMLAQRNFERAAFADDDKEHSRYFAAGQRNASIAREVIPTAQAISSYGQSAYKALQGLTNVGATQIIGAVGSEQEIGGVGFRDPFNRAARQGAEIALHQANVAKGAGINIKQMQEIDSIMMGMGMNFNNYRFSRGERYMAHLAKYNPTIDQRLAAEQAKYAMKFGTTEDLAKLAKTIEGLSVTAAASNVSVQELQQQMLSYSETTVKLGGYYEDAAANHAYMAATMPGIDPNKQLATLQTNPLAQQRAMSMGFLPHQVGAMSGPQQRRAIEGSIGESWQSITGMTLNETSEKFLRSEEGKKKLADMQTLFHYDQYTLPELSEMISGADRRAKADAAVNRYFQTDEQGMPITKNGHAVGTKALEDLFRKDEAGGEGFGIDRATFDEAMKQSGVRGNRAKSLWDQITKDVDWEEGLGYGDDLTGAKDKVLAAIQAARTGGAGAPTDDWNKVLKGLEQAKQGFEALKNKQGDNSEEKK